MPKVGPKEAQRRALREAKNKPYVDMVPSAGQYHRNGAPFLMEGAVVTVSGFGLPQPIENAVIGKDGFPKNKKQRKLYKLLTRRGRPPLDLAPAQRAERKRAQTLKRVQKLRAKRKK